MKQLEHKISAKTILIVIGCILTVILTMLAVTPFLNEVLAVEVSQAELPVVTQAPAPGKPEELLVTAIYEMEVNSKKISAIYIEIFHAGCNEIVHVQVPVDTRVTLSESLYKSLQTYAPELPQYLKLSNMAESFSAEYGQTGSNRILSEVLGISIEEYVRADAETLEKWLAAVKEEKNGTFFFEEYTSWLENSASSLTKEERWTYYENWKQVNQIAMEEVPGGREKDGYLVSAKRSRERFQELMLRPESE
ncbi:MAG: hypothetical protein J6K04_03390 [Lachnospiraceae bacterium]|nr:hypothetical protein [Lachnospiraceae bacterium]